MVTGAVLDLPPGQDEDWKVEQQRSEHSEFPQYHLILWDSQHHSFGYAVRMLQEILRIEPERGFHLVEEIHRDGFAVVFTGPKEQAEFYQRSIQCHGKDATVASCNGSMKATVEEVR